MKTLFACTIAVAVTTAAIGWADHAAADEPFELNRSQLDRITAGRPTESVGLNYIEIKGSFDEATLELEFSLRVDSPGTEFEHTVVRTFSFQGSFPSR